MECSKCNVDKSGKEYEGVAHKYFIREDSFTLEIENLDIAHYYVADADYRFGHLTVHFLSDSNLFVPEYLDNLGDNFKCGNGKIKYYDEKGCIIASTELTKLILLDYHVSSLDYTSSAPFYTEVNFRYEKEINKGNDYETANKDKENT